MDNYSGYLLTWDLDKGFVKGAKFENSVAVYDLNTKTKVKPNSITAKEAPIPLEEVIVSASAGIYSSSPRSFSISSSFGGGGPAPKAGAYINPPHGASESGSSVVVTKSPCEKLKELLNNPAFKAKLDELKNKTAEKKENGYSQNKDGTFTALTANGSDAVTMSKDVNRLGYMHTHLDPYERADTNGDLEPVAPIKMFSPEDVRQFLIVVNNAQYNNIPISDTYGIMVSSTGTYQLKFTGNVADINAKNSSINWGGLDDIYAGIIKENGIEAGFLQFLRDKIGIDGIEIYKIEITGGSQITLDSTGKTTTINCN